MPGQIPPQGVAMEPVFTVLPAGSLIWRCHAGHYGVGQFNSRTAHEHFKGSRFDSTEADPYPYLYAALDPVTALAEVLLRSVEFSGGKGTAARQIPWGQASRYLLSAVRTAVDVRLVDITSAEGLAAVWQDEWLVTSLEYAQTRYWVRLIREHSASAQGLCWTSKRCMPRRALQFFGDRCGEHLLAPTPEECYRLGSPTDAKEINRMLSPLHAVISEPGI
ncbi:RES family NAD+ phosphorylase [Streptomyces sp. KM273126]|uniref:RES family NAD+ phosphorylase n=1 Tax=Streptomyces sp. KM273126 TaxID=2545247 RepID=UPI00103AADAA|nr:RES family NAD+ phosphorylase [Streptomyces sp. KM273126]MBA2807788.1 RES family NAD+ phosphorylase [Streptomyces sp. KM273126]